MALAESEELQMQASQEQQAEAAEAELAMTLARLESQQKQAEAAESELAMARAAVLKLAEQKPAEETEAAKKHPPLSQRQKRRFKEREQKRRHRIRLEEKRRAEEQQRAEELAARAAEEAAKKAAEEAAVFEASQSLNQEAQLKQEAEEEARMQAYLASDTYAKKKRKLQAAESEADTSAREAEAAKQVQQEADRELTELEKLVEQTTLAKICGDRYVSPAKQTNLKAWLTSTAKEEDNSTRIEKAIAWLKDPRGRRAKTVQEGRRQEEILALHAKLLETRQIQKDKEKLRKAKTKEAAAAQAKVKQLEKRLFLGETRGRKRKLQPATEEAQQQVKLRRAELKIKMRGARRSGIPVQRFRTDVSPEVKKAALAYVKQSLLERSSGRQSRGFWRDMEQETRLTEQMLKKLLTPHGEKKLEEDLKAFRERHCRGRKRYWRSVLAHSGQGLRAAREKGGILGAEKAKVKSWYEEQLKSGFDVGGAEIIDQYYLELEHLIYCLDSKVKRAKERQRAEQTGAEQAPEQKEGEEMPADELDTDATLPVEQPTEEDLSALDSEERLKHHHHHHHHLGFVCGSSSGRFRVILGSFSGHLGIIFGSS